MKQPGELFAEFLNDAARDPLPSDIAGIDSETSIDVCGREETVTVRPEELTACYLPLARTLIEIQSRAPDTRLLVAVAGCPGAGKSVFALLLAHVTNVCLAHDAIHAARAVVAPLDGFHYTNAYLDSHCAAGANISLAKMKGRPETFDVEAAIQAFSQLRSLGDELLLPGYSRRIHEPVEKKIRVGDETLIVIAEGNFLCMTKDAAWRRLAELFDLKIFIDTDRKECRSGLVRRHVRGGRSSEDAIRHYEAVDLPNATLVEQTRGAADIIVRRAGGKIRCTMPNTETDAHCNENKRE